MFQLCEALATSDTTTTTSPKLTPSSKLSTIVQRCADDKTRRRKGRRRRRRRSWSGQQSKAWRRPCYKTLLNVDEMRHRHTAADEEPPVDPVLPSVRCSVYPISIQDRISFMNNPPSLVRDDKYYLRAGCCSSSTAPSHHPNTII